MKSSSLFEIEVLKDHICRTFKLRIFRPLKDVGEWRIQTPPMSAFHTF